MADNLDDFIFHSKINLIILRQSALFSIVAIVFLSGTFRFADIFGIRLILQIIFSVPVVLYFLFRVFQFPYKIINVIVIYAVIKLVFELLLQARGAYVMENGLLIMALFIIVSARNRDLDKIVFYIIWIATFFCTLALIQWVVSFIFQDLIVNSMEFTESDQLLKGDNNLFSYLGFFSTKQYEILGRSVARHQSFAREPSLVLIYFYLPACIALLHKHKKYWINFWVIFLFCLLSFSGSVILAVSTSILFYLLLQFVNIKVFFPLGPIGLMLFYLTYIKNSGLEVILAFFQELGSKNDLLFKKASVSDRALPALDSWSEILTHPLGGAAESNATGPWLVNAGLSTGWVGITLLIIFLFSFGKQMSKLQAQHLFSDKVGLSLILGGFAVYIVFNDYAMNSYSGLLLTTLIYRVIICRNQDFIEKEIKIISNGIT